MFIILTPRVLVKLSRPRVGFPDSLLCLGLIPEHFFIPAV